MRAILPLLLVVSLPLAAAPLHSQFLPPDDQSLRQEAPTSQQLLQVTDYSVVVGAQRQSDQQGDVQIFEQLAHGFEPLLEKVGDCYGLGGPVPSICGHGGGA